MLEAFSGSFELNAISIAYLAPVAQISFVNWMAFALPLTIAMLLVGYGLLWWRTRTISASWTRRDDKFKKALSEAGEGTDPAGQIAFLIVLAVTALLWLTEPLHNIPSAVVAIGSAAFIFVSGMLKKKDLAKLDWSTLLLIAGGITLGRLFEQSGLIKAIAANVPFGELDPRIGLFVLCLASFAQAQKKFVLSPFQSNVQNCIDSKINIEKIDTNKKLYDSIKQFYPLTSFETLFREVEYSMKGEQKKLKFEDGIIQIFNVEGEDEVLKLVSTEKFDENRHSVLTRHKVRSAEARMNQLLFRADIKSDYQKIKEVRAKKLELNIVFSDSHIKSLAIEFTGEKPGEKKVLNCQQKDQTDICNCRL